jgi:hypothetical protein
MKTTTFAPVQISYFAAKALCDTVLAECNAEAHRLGLFDRDDDEGMDACDALFAPFRAASEALRTAEEAMVAWSCRRARSYSPRHGAMIAKLETDARRSPKHWRQLVDLSARLAA